MQTVTPGALMRRINSAGTLVPTVPLGGCGSCSSLFTVTSDHPEDTETVASVLPHQLYGEKSACSATDTDTGVAGVAAAITRNHADML